jgi:hypothetical protein
VRWQSLANSRKSLGNCGGRWAWCGVWRDQGKPKQARDLLAPVYGWFIEGVDMRDLKEAEVLLDELHA